MRRSVLFSIALISACKPDNALIQQPFKEPVLELTTPAPAAWAPAGSMKAEGHSENLEGLMVLEEQATLEGQRFSATIPVDRGINLVEAGGLDMRGDRHFVRNGLLAGEFKDPSGDVLDAAQVRVNQGGLDAILKVAAPMVSVESIIPFITNPVYEYSYTVDLGFWDFELANAKVYMTQLGYDQPQLSADPQMHVLNVHGVIPNLYTQLYVYVDVAGLFSVDTYVDVYADRVTLDLPMTLTANAHRIHVGLNTPVTSIDGFYFDTSILPSEIEGTLLSGFVEGYLQDTLPGMMAEMIPPLLEEKLSALDLSFATDLMGHPLAVSAGFAAADVDNDGIVLDVDLDAEIPGTGDLPYEGYLTADEFNESPEADHTADVSMSLYDDLLNRVMFEAWSAGLLEMTMSTDDGTLTPLMLAPLQATQGTITISGKLPPVIVSNDAGDLIAQLGEIELVIDTPDGGLGTHLVASVTAFVPLEVNVQDNVLSLALGTPDFHITVRDSDWGADNGTVTNVLEQMMPVNALLGMLGDFSFPLPALPGISVASGEASRDGLAHTGVIIDLQ